MEGHCQKTAVDVFYIYNVSQVLGKVWNGIDAERRQESIDRLRTRAVELSEKGEVRREDVNKYFGTLDRAEDLNKKEGRKYEQVGYISEGHILSQLQNFLKDNALDLAIHAIADCECLGPLPGEKEKHIGKKLGERRPVRIVEETKLRQR